MRLLLDTHVWLWTHFAPERLSKRVARLILDESNEVWLSPISVWEFLLLVERGRMQIEGDPARWLETAWTMGGVREAPLNREVMVLSRAVRVSHQDPADRFLAATAQLLDLTLVTADALLLRGKGYRTLAAS